MAKDTREIIGKNIQELRLNHKLTQFELAQKLNYSDKAVSKWERGESTPDPDVFLKLSEIFNVKIDYFFHEEHKEQYINPKNQKKVKDILVVTLLSIAAFTISTAIFLLGCFRSLNNASTYWVAFIYAIPLSSLFVLHYFRKYRIIPGKIVTSSILLWSALAAVYLQSLVLGYNPWIIFIIGVPLEPAIIVYNLVNK